RRRRGRGGRLDDLQLGRSRGVNAVTGRAGSRAVTLSQRSADGQYAAGLDRPTVERRRTDDRSYRAAAVIDGDAETVGELVGRRGHGAADLDAATLVDLTGGSGVDRLDSRQRGVGPPDEIPFGDAQRP